MTGDNNSRARETLDSCLKHRGNPQCYYVPPPTTVPPPPPTQPVIVEPLCEDLPQCESSAAQGICLNECWERWEKWKLFDYHCLSYLLYIILFPPKNIVNCPISDSKMTRTAVRPVPTCASSGLPRRRPTPTPAWTAPPSLTPPATSPAQTSVARQHGAGSPGTHQTPVRHDPNRCHIFIPLDLLTGSECVWQGWLCQVRLPRQLLRPSLQPGVSCCCQQGTMSSGLSTAQESPAPSLPLLLIWPHSNQVGKLNVVLCLQGNLRMLFWMSEQL